MGETGRDPSDASTGRGTPGAPEPGGDKGQTLSQSFQKKPALPTPRFQTAVS